MDPSNGDFPVVCDVTFSGLRKTLTYKLGMQNAVIFLKGNFTIQGPFQPHFSDVS